MEAKQKEYAAIICPDDILKELGIDAYLTVGSFFEIANKDAYNGMYAPCSEAWEIDSQGNRTMKTFTYLVPTRFLKFTGDEQQERRN